jgi:hypothetical protein
MEYFDKKRAHAGHFTKCLQSCEEKSARGKRKRARTLRKMAVESAKGDVREDHKKRLLRAKRG